MSPGVTFVVLTFAGGVLGVLAGAAFVQVIVRRSRKPSRTTPIVRLHRRPGLMDINVHSRPAGDGDLVTVVVLTGSKLEHALLIGQMMDRDLQPLRQIGGEIAMESKVTFSAGCDEDQVAQIKEHYAKGQD